jgi:hypothetical protein
MHNPWLQKNPWLSIWLSTANSVAGSARGFATAELQREMRKAQAEMTAAMTQQIVDFWSMKHLTPAPARRASSRKRKTRR